MTLPAYINKGLTASAIGSFSKLNALVSLTLGVSTGLTASTTHTRAGALALTEVVNNLGTVAGSGDAVGLPAAVAGAVVIVFNGGANPAAVFPAASADTIDGGSAGASVTLTNAKRAMFVCVATGIWISAQLGVVSA
jgi:hypothetical protein